MGLLGTRKGLIGFEVSQNWCHFFGGPQNKDHSIWESILGLPYSGTRVIQGLRLGIRT